MNESRRRRRLGLQQYIPREPQPMFQIVEPQPNVNYWHVKIKDAIVGDEPEFRKTLPKSRANWPTPQQVANAGAGELNEARGIVSLTRYEDGIPVFSAQYAANSREVFCLWSTDEDIPSVKNGLISLTPPWPKKDAGLTGQQRKAWLARYSIPIKRA